MRRSLFLLLILLIGTSSISAQLVQSALWEISGNGLTKKSYLFGTVHVSSTEILTKYPKLKQVLTDAELGLFEINGNPIGDEPVSKTALKEVPQPPLDSIFTPEEYTLVDDFFSKSPLGSIRPHNNDASLTGMLQVAITYKNNKGNQYITLDSYLNNLMDSLGKQIFQLDNINDRSKLAFETQYRLIAETLVAVIKQADDSMSKNYISPDYEKSLKADLQLATLPNKIMGSVTIERNKIWLPKIIEKVKTNSCFIAVGLGHLQYQTGLIILLRKQGYSLKPISVVE